jgi:hypothetical protein
MEQSIIFALDIRSIAKLKALAIFACLVSSPDALAQQIDPAPPLGMNAPWAPRAPAPAIKPTQPNQIPTQVLSAPARGNVNRGGGTPLLRTEHPRTDRLNSSGVRQAPSAVVQPARPRAVVRKVARRITVAGGVLVLPEVAYYGVPIILDVPDLGYVEVSEDEYARLYKQLSSSDQEQVDGAIASLRAIKSTEDAEVEAARRGSAPGDGERDLSEPMSFGRPSKITEPSRRLY